MDRRELEKLARHRDYEIAIANIVIDEMRLGLSAKQQKILDFMLKEIKPLDTQDKRYSISIKDYCKEFNIDYRKNSTNYLDIKDAVKSINQHSKWIITNDETNEQNLVQWFRNITINPTKATIEYNIDDTVAPYLFGLINKGNYTTHTERETGAFESKYSRPLYLILKRYLEVGIKEPILQIDKLRVLLAAERYKRNPDFLRYVLDMAKKEINDFTFMRVGYEAKKGVGSKGYTYIVFNVEWVKENDKDYELREWNNAKKFGEMDLYLPF